MDEAQEANEKLRQRIAFLLSLTPEGLTSRRIAFVTGRSVRHISNMLAVMARRGSVSVLNHNGMEKIYTLRKYG